MFEIYRAAYDGGFRVVYYTELDDDNKDTEIERALAGQHFYDGFILTRSSDEAKQIIDAVIGRLNEGEQVDTQELDLALASHSP
jgi:hypothetical protein